MPAAQYDSTTLTVTAGDYTLTAKGRILRFDGWTKVLPQQSKSAEDQALPDVSVNSKLNLSAVQPQQYFTKPPARFSEAALVKELEKRGIGRPSTYAAIISTIQERGYVRTENRRFSPRIWKMCWTKSRPARKTGKPNKTNSSKISRLN